ncbi:MAG: hypothetical protein KBG29_13835 [Pseudomonadales bacterium]|nr:hypothetical protein [Pseudomonadales bacterium]
MTQPYTVPPFTSIDAIVLDTAPCDFSEGWVIYYRKIGRWRIQTRPVRWKAEGPPESPPAGQCAARP